MIPNPEEMRRRLFHPPIIFLDYEGVLMTKDYVNRVNPACVQRLDRFLRTTSGKLVITAPSRDKETRASSQRLLRNWGVDVAEVLGFTPILGWDMTSPNQRSKEILEWLVTHEFTPPTFINFVVFDSLYMALGRKLVQIEQGHYHGGLLEKHLDQAYKIMRETAAAQKNEFPALMTPAASEAGVGG